MRDRRRHHHRRRRSSSLESFSDLPFISCAATPAKYLIKQIRRGKFVGFDKLLLPVLDESITVDQAVGQAAKRIRDTRPARRRVVDLVTWLEAWNIFFPVRLQVSPSSALQLAKYQTIMCQLFSSYPVGVCIKYDSLDSGTGQIPPYTLGPSEGRHPSVVRDLAHLSSPQAAICQHSAYLCRQWHKQGYPKVHHPHTVRSGNVPKIQLFLLPAG